MFQSSDQKHIKRKGMRNLNKLCSKAHTKSILKKKHEKPKRTISLEEPSPCVFVFMVCIKI